MTIRRRFLLASSLARLIQRERGGFRQVEGFFPAQRDRASWVRLEENRAFLILRAAGPIGETEEQTEVPVAHAHALLDVCAGEVDYARTKLQIGDRAALVDQIFRPRPFHVVTVEFDADGEARAFRPLPWFGPEVTGDARYTNQSLALSGLNEAPDVPLSNEALDSLIDTLENRFPAQARIPVSRPTATQVSVTKAPVGPTAGNGQGTKINLGDLEAAMMGEMERALQGSRTS
jgi:CYTH domain-containing protein